MSSHAKRPLRFLCLCALSALRWADGNPQDVSPVRKLENSPLPMCRAPIACAPLPWVTPHPARFQDIPVHAWVPLYHLELRIHPPVITVPRESQELGNCLFEWWDEAALLYFDISVNQNVNRTLCSTFSFAQCISL